MYKNYVLVNNATCLIMRQSLEVVVVVVVKFVKSQVLAPDNGGDLIYLIILVVVSTPNLRLERLLASLSFAQIFYTVP